MIHTVAYSTAETTAEIMSRYRPIAPKPHDPRYDNSALPDGITKSPYLRGIWAYLQARPTRTRKRGRPAPFPPSYVRRTRAHHPPPIPHALMIDRGHRAEAAPHVLQFGSDQSRIAGAGIDLNTASKEFDNCHPFLLPAVISPKPVRPVRSRIIMTSLTFHQAVVQAAKTPEEVEAILEAEAAPAIVSDSRNKVRLANSAYKEMVGQPECGWLGGKRIGGEVAIEFGRDWEELWQSAAAAAAAVEFDCLAKMEWEREGKKKSVNACGKGVKMECRDRDYIFLWRFSITTEY